MPIGNNGSNQKMLLCENLFSCDYLSSKLSKTIYACWTLLIALHIII